MPSARNKWWICLAMLVFATVRGEEIRPPLPEMKLELNSSFYPTAAKDARVQGRVLVAFNISKRGKIEKENVVEAEPLGAFEESALSVLKKIKFTVPDNWDDIAGPLQRYRLSVLFKISPCPPDTCTAPKAYDESDDFVIVGTYVK
jgi:TonB family protein